MPLKRLAPSSHNQWDSSVLIRLLMGEKRALKYSKVVGRLGPNGDEYEFNLPLLPLVTQSAKLRKVIESTFDENGKGPAIHDVGNCAAFVIDLPDFQCDQEILRMVEDLCYGVMEENHISTSNVVRLFNAGRYLEIKKVKLRALRFLEKKASFNWEHPLCVLATSGWNDLARLENLEDMKTEKREITLFERCMETFLAKIIVRMSTCNTWTLSCNVECLLRVAQLLPANIANYIYEYCRAERFGLLLDSDYCDQDYADLYESCPVLAISSHLKVDTRREDPCAARFHSVVFVHYSSEAVRWIESLPDLLPDVARRSLLVLHLAKMMRVENTDVGICSSTLEWGFLCVLLVEASRLSIETEENTIATGLDEEIVLLQKLVSQGLGQVCQFAQFRRQQDLRFSRQLERVLGLIMKFKYDTLVSILEHFRSLASDDVIGGVANIVDCCIREHLEAESFTMQQAWKIHKAFPNDKRPSHLELFETLWRKCVSPEDLFELIKLLDYNEVTADIGAKLSEELIDTVDQLFQEVELDFVTFLKKFVTTQPEKRTDRDESDEVITKLSEVTPALLKMWEDKMFHESKLEDELKKVAGIQTAQPEKRTDREESDEVITKLSEVTPDLLKMWEDKMLHESKLEDELKKVARIQTAQPEKWTDREESDEVITKLSEVTPDLLKMWEDKMLHESKLEDELKKSAGIQTASDDDLVHSLLKKELRHVRTRKLLAVTEGLRALQKSTLLIRREQDKLIDSKREIETQRDTFRERMTLAENERDVLCETLQEDKRIVEFERDMMREHNQLLVNQIHRENQRCSKIHEDALNEGKMLAEKELNTLQEGKKLVESQLHASKHDLEEEKNKTTCQICYLKPRDALCLPCMHFHYCAGCLHIHLERKKWCPTCRAFTSGVLKCNLDL